MLFYLQKCTNQHFSSRLYRKDTRLRTVYTLIYCVCIIKNIDTYWLCFFQVVRLVSDNIL